jgi:hypothetical protein
MAWRRICNNKIFLDKQFEESTMNMLKTTGIILAMGFLILSNAEAAPRIAILNFELNDITSLPNTAQEQLRTASIQPLLEQALSQSGEYEIIRIKPEAQLAANSSFGYLFRFNDLAAAAGRRLDSRQSAQQAQLSVFLSDGASDQCKNPNPGGKLCYRT